MLRTSLVVPLALVTLAAACVESEDDALLGEGVAGLGVFDGNGDPCPKLGCGSNSAHVGPLEFHELDETGHLANAEGLRITDFTKGRLSYRLDVTGTTLTGKSYQGGAWVTTLSGSDLVNAKIHLAGPGGAAYIITIVAVTSQQMWQAPFVAIETYEMTWSIPGTGYMAAVPNVCVNPPSRKEGEMALWDNAKEVILFTGDRYDTDAKTVTSTSPSSWFNVACAGTVMAKLALNRHTSATATSTINPTWAQRQAMLKMYSSDICGTGQALTVTGTPIYWVSTTGLSSPMPYYTMEARWNENGAMCLSTHRLHGTSNDMDAQIQAACGTLPPCTSNPPAYYLRTSSPVTP